MKKHLLLVLAVLVCTQAYSQCNSFDWRNNLGSAFFKGLVQQPFQGPCVSYAAARAIETTYRIDAENANANIDLSEAYIYAQPNVIGNQSLDSKIRSTARGAGPSLSFSVLPSSCTGDFFTQTNMLFPCGFNGNPAQIYPYEAGIISYSQPAQANCNAAKGFSYNLEVNESGTTFFTEVCVECKTSNCNYPVSVGNMNSRNTVGLKVDDLKGWVLDRPVLIHIRYSNQIDYLSGVNASGNGIVDHAYVIIGYTNSSFLLADSYPGASGVKTVSANTLVNYLKNYPNNRAFTFHNITYGANQPGAPSDVCSGVPSTSKISFPGTDELQDGTYTKLEVEYNYSSGEVCSCPITDIEWSIPSSYLRNETRNGNYGSIEVEPNTSASAITYKVRVKNANGWSAWKYNVAYILDPDGGLGGGGMY